MSKCNLCDAPITWAKTVAGKSIPLDMVPVPNGNAFYNDDGKVVIASKDAQPPEGGRRFSTHFTHCTVYAAKKKLEALLK